MRVTIDLPGVTPELLKLAASYLGNRSRAEYLRETILESLETVKEDAIPGPDGDCIGSRWDIEDELFPKSGIDARTLEIEALRAEVVLLRAELRDRDGGGWHDNEAEEA